MAKAYKCDYCGKLYEDIPLEGFDINVDLGEDKKSRYISHGMFSDMFHVDLCSDCTDAVSEIDVKIKYKKEAD